MSEHKVLPTSDGMRPITLSEVEVEDKFLMDILDDLRDKLHKKWDAGEKAVIKRRVYAQSEELLRMIRASEFENRVIYCNSHPIGILSYSRDNDVLTLRFFHIHSRFGEQQNLEQDLFNHLSYIFFVDPTISKLVVELPEFCRFDHDSEILRQLGFCGEEWMWMFIALQDFQRQPQDIVGYNPVAWDNMYRAAVPQLDDIEAGIILDFLENQGRERGIDPETSAIATQGTEICGAILVQSAEPFIEYLVVSGPHRRRGLGRSLVIQALCKLKATGSTVVGVSVNIDNKISESLFRGVGFSSCIPCELIYSIYRSETMLLNTDTITLSR